MGTALTGWMWAKLFLQHCLLCVSQASPQKYEGLYPGAGRDESRLSDGSAGSQLGEEANELQGQMSRPGRKQQQQHMLVSTV